MTEEDMEGWPEPAKQVARRFPATQCYREVARKLGHYWLIGLAVRQTGEVDLDVLHDADSFLPGMQTSLSPEQMVVCGCGQWQEATEEQIGHMREHFAALERARACAPKRPTDG